MTSYNAHKKWWSAVLKVAVSFCLFFSRMANSSEFTNTNIDVNTNTSTHHGLLFQSDSDFDNVKVTTDSDSLDLWAPTVTRCTLWCQQRTWCTSFFFTASSGDCSLHATAFLDPSHAAASSGTRYFRNVVDWCQSQKTRLYHRQTEMCVYYETDSGKFARWSESDSACVSVGMRLASNTSPTKMDALIDMTKKNRPAIPGDVIFGLKRKVSTTFEWMDGQIMDNTAMQRFWGDQQPNGLSFGQDCLVISLVEGLWNDQKCSLSFAFVCELLKPAP